MQRPDPAKQAKEARTCQRIAACQLHTIGVHNHITYDRGSSGRSNVSLSHGPLFVYLCVFCLIVLQVLRALARSVLVCVCVCTIGFILLQRPE